MTYLKPCPFCGFEPDRDASDCVYPTTWAYAPEQDKIVYTVWNLVCYETGGGCGAHVLGDSPDDVVSKWNKRV